MKKPKFQIGDKVWVAGYDQSDTQVECPDCMGAKHVKVTLKDGTEYSLDCSGCAPGYDKPRGWVKRYERKATAWPGTVQRVEVSHRDSDTYHYGTHNRSADEDDVFATHDEAVVRAADVIRRREEEDKTYRIHEKERNHRTWSWHVTYYRSQIRDAKKTIERVTAQLHGAREKAKAVEKS